MRESGAARAGAAEFHIEEEHSGTGTVVLAIYGDTDLYVASALRDRLTGVIEEGASSLVVDLSGVTFLDSMAIGVLLGGLKRLRTRGGQLRLVVPGTHVRRIFEMTLLDKVFALDSAREDALAALAPPAGSSSLGD